MGFFSSGLLVSWPRRFARPREQTSRQQNNVGFISDQWHGWRADAFDFSENKLGRNAAAGEAGLSSQKAGKRIKDSGNSFALRFTAPPGLKARPRPRLHYGQIYR